MTAEAWPSNKKSSLALRVLTTSCLPRTIGSMKWKTAYDHEDYEVSTTGRVRRRTDHKLSSRWKVGRELTRQLSHRGYFKVKLEQKYVPVARLVAETFLRPRPPGLVVNHKNGMKVDNDVRNLEWISKSEDAKHAIRTGLWKTLRGEDHGNAKLTVGAVKDIRSTFRQTQRLAAKYQVTEDLVRRVRRREIWRHVEP